LPGAAEVLTALARVPGVVQTVLTGNLRAVAVVKLRVFGLHRHIDFEVGAYGEDDPERTKLVAIAQHRSGVKYETEFTLRNTVIVGDTKNDVTAADVGGAKIIAVASGRDSLAELRDAGAEVVLPDLVDTYVVVNAILSSNQPFSPTR
jgi:phosphoglycolate phosphatase-like HAD superfamily hydrolase